VRNTGGTIGQITGEHLRSGIAMHAEERPVVCSGVIVVPACRFGNER
jgi:hypothetical protein